jgi:hypothetical protein
MLTGYDTGIVACHVMTFFLNDIVEMREGRFKLKMPNVRICNERRTEAIQLRSDFIQFVCSTFGSSSRKYVQNYLGWFWSVVDRKTWRPNSIDAGLFRSGRMSPAEARDYVSPTNLKCPLSFFYRNINNSAMAITAA